MFIYQTIKSVRKLNCEIVMKTEIGPNYKMPNYQVKNNLASLGCVELP